MLDETVSVPRAVPANCQRLKNTDLHGGDIADGSTPDHGFNDCMARCLARPDCHHFTILYNKCWLKDNNDGQVSLKGGTSGTCYKHGHRRVRRTFVLPEVRHFPAQFPPF